MSLLYADLSLPESENSVGLLNLLTSEARYRYVRYNVTNKVNLIVQFIAIISSFKICTSTVHIIFTFHIFHELR